MCNSIFQVDAPYRAVNDDCLSIANALERTLRVDHRWNGVLAGNDGTVRKLAANFQHDSTHQRKDWCPTGVCCLCYQNIAWSEPRSLANAAYNTCRATYLTTTGGYALQK